MAIVPFSKEVDIRGHVDIHGHMAGIVSPTIPLVKGKNLDMGELLVDMIRQVRGSHSLRSTIKAFLGRNVGAMKRAPKQTEIGGYPGSAMIEYTITR